MSTDTHLDTITFIAFKSVKAKTVFICNGSVTRIVTVLPGPPQKMFIK